jgi:hypothetical protein
MDASDGGSQFTGPTLVFSGSFERPFVVSRVPETEAARATCFVRVLIVFR